MLMALNDYYNEVVKYYEKHGNLLIPVSYKVGKINIGYWIQAMRVKYHQGKLSEEQIQFLTKFGMVWDVHDLLWENNYKLAKVYYEEHGNLLIPSYYMVNGANLGTWITSQRNSYKMGTLSEVRKQLLNDIGMVWRVRNRVSFEDGLKAAIDYKNENGNLLVPINYEVNGFKLGEWIHNQRVSKKNGSLDKIRIKKLDEIEMIWDANKYVWDYNFNVLKKYFEENNTNHLPDGYCEHGINLDSWYKNQQQKYKDGTLDEKSVKLLESIGFHFSNEENWNIRYNLAKQYFLKHGNLDINRFYEVDNILLGHWINTQRSMYKNGKLSESRIKLLNDIKMIWDYRRYQLLNNEITSNSLKNRRLQLSTILNKMLEEKENVEFITSDDVKKIEKEFMLRLYK